MTTMPVAEILSIGTELLLGQILNTNAHYLASEMAAIGIDCFYQVTVGDNPARIKLCWLEALRRSDIVIATGGLGPTADDLTHECLADLFKVDMDFDPYTLEHIKTFFKRRGISMPESNRKQAMRPHGASILQNPYGTAPGIIWKIGPASLKELGIADPERQRVILTFPGVPGEMKKMWQETAKSFLASSFTQATVCSWELKHYGIGESALAEKYGHLLNLSMPTVAPLAGQGECRLRITAKATTEEEAWSIAAPIIDEIKAGSGYLCYGENQDTLESVVGALLTQKQLSLAVAESCTGGLVSKRLTDNPGSSAYIRLNAVTYANAAKIKLLGVPEKTIDRYGAVSSECAAEMAQGIRSVAGTDFGLAITGIAGPDGGSQEKPVGLVYLGLADSTGTIVSKRVYPAQLTRGEIRQRAANDALNMVRLLLLDKTVLQNTYTL